MVLNSVFGRTHIPVKVHVYTVPQPNLADIYNLVTSRFSIGCVFTGIEGPSTSCLANGKRRVEIVVWSSRNKEPPTHFISIPLNQPQVKKRMAVFQEKALAIRRNVSYSTVITT